MTDTSATTPSLERAHAIAREILAADPDGCCLGTVLGEFETDDDAITAAAGIARENEHQECTELAAMLGAWSVRDRNLFVREPHAEKPPEPDFRLHADLEQVQFTRARWKCRCGAVGMISSVDNAPVVQALIRGGTVRGTCNQCDGLVEIAVQKRIEPPRQMTKRLGPNLARAKVNSGRR